MEKNKKDRDSLVEASWELFFKTGDPFYIMAKNTFEDKEEGEDKILKCKVEEDGKNDNNKGDMS